MANLAQGRYAKGMACPPPSSYPQGWFLIEWSSNLAAGEVKPVRYFDQELVLFRTQSGKACVADAHCPHLGAHLGHGGCVKGESIECPFHHWAFGAEDGQCSKIPFTQRVHPHAKLRLWPVQEQGGMILAWFDPERKAPAWDFPAPLAQDPCDWTEWTETAWTIKSRVYEISENDVDRAHAPAVHDFTRQLPRVELHTEGPLMHVTLHAQVALEPFGGRGEIPGIVYQTKIGLGFLLVRQSMEYKGLRIKIQSVGTFTPVDEDHVHIRARHRIGRLSVPFLTRVVHRRYHNNFKRTVEQDIPIWEHKIYRAAPKLFETDGPIMRYRSWAKQFWPEQAANELAGAQAPRPKVRLATL